MTVPGQVPFSITYDSISDLGHVDHVNGFISTSLVQYRSDEYIESVLMFTVQRNMSTWNGTLLECIIADLANDSIIIITTTRMSGINCCVNLKN